MKELVCDPVSLTLVLPDGGQDALYVLSLNWWGSHADEVTVSSPGLPQPIVKCKAGSEGPWGQTRLSGPPLPTLTV